MGGERLFLFIQLIPQTQVGIIYISTDLIWCPISLGESLKKRSRIDIYAAILGFLKRHPDGCQVTRLSYGAGLPIDRIKLMFDTLARCDLINVHVIGEPLQAILNQRRYYSITRKP